MAAALIITGADRLHSRKSQTPLSTLFRCPVLREVFRRAERDNDGAFAVPAPKHPTLNGGASVKPSRALVLA